MRDIIEFIAAALNAGTGVVKGLDSLAVIPTGAKEGNGGFLDGTNVRRCGFEAAVTCISCADCYDILEDARTTLAELDLSQTDIIGIEVISEALPKKRLENGLWSCRFEGVVSWAENDAPQQTGETLTVGGIDLSNRLKLMEITEEERIDEENSYTDVDGGEHIVRFGFSSEIRARVELLDEATAESLCEVLGMPRIYTEFSAPAEESGYYACKKRSAGCDCVGGRLLWWVDFRLREVS